MSKEQQAEKNMELSASLADYLVAHPQAHAVGGAGVSYVPFSLNDSALNSLNDQLVDQLVAEGKTVVKAEQPPSSKESWKLTVVGADG